jgi:hypothetical protein
MDIDQPIRLRPRFEHKTNFSKARLHDRLTDLKKTHQDLRFKQSDDHIWIHLPKDQEKIFTPHLHLEILEDPDHQTRIKGLYSPNSVYWTLFMFLHFILATAFIALMIIAYSKSVLNDSIKLYIFLMIGVVLIWISLYVFARINRRKGLPQAKSLEELFKQWVDEKQAIS